MGVDFFSHPDALTMDKMAAFQQQQEHMFNASEVQQNVHTSTMQSHNKGGYRKRSHYERFSDIGKDGFQDAMPNFNDVWKQRRR